MKTYRAIVTASVEINVEDDADVIERVTGPGGDEWRASLYKLHTPEDVVEHLAYNAVANGVLDISRLDGWADLPPNKGWMWTRIEEIDVEPVDPAQEAAS